MTLVSVIIPCFNAREWIRETLASVCAQNMDDVEVIVVDDGSTDDSAEIVAATSPWVHLIRTANGGPSRARNTGIQASHSEFIQFLDADDLLAKDKLRTQLKALEDTGADVAYGDWQRLRLQSDGSYIEADVVSRRIEGDTEIALFADFWCPPAVYLFRRAIVEKIGGWNERLPVIQDARFALDCALHGADFEYCPRIMAYYRVHASDSVSTRNATAFTRDCFRNALEVEEWWQGHGGLDRARRATLLKIYNQVARASFEIDPDTFESAYQQLERLRPGYVPDSPRHLALVSKLIGYRRAEKVAVAYRRIKALMLNHSNHGVQ